MSNLFSYAFGSALVVSSLLFNSAVQAQTKPFSKAATGTVSGRVTVKGKGAPGIAVAVRDVDFSSRSGTLFKAMTDQDGNYGITNVLAGNYQVALSPGIGTEVSGADIGEISGHCTMNTAKQLAINCRETILVALKNYAR